MLLPGAIGSFPTRSPLANSIGQVRCMSMDYPLLSPPDAFGARSFFSKFAPASSLTSLLAVRRRRVSGLYFPDSLISLFFPPADLPRLPPAPCNVDFPFLTFWYGSHTLQPTFHLCIYLEGLEAAELFGEYSVLFSGLLLLLYPNRRPGFASLFFERHGEKYACSPPPLSI